MVGPSTKIRQFGASAAFGAVTAIAAVVLAVILNLNADCNGISVANFPLQQAWELDRAKWIVKNWPEVCKVQAANQVWLDYPFILAYSGLLFFIGLKGRQAAERRNLSALAFIAGLSAWGGLLGGLFDCLENIGLLVMILREPAPITPVLTSICSSLKIVLSANTVLVGINVFVATRTYPVGHFAER